MKNPPHPGAIIREEILAPLRLTVTQASRILDVGRAALSAVLNGRASLSPEMALRIEKAFGPKMDMLLRMQLAYDLARTRKTASSLRVKPYRPAPDASQD